MRLSSLCALALSLSAVACAPAAPPSAASPALGRSAHLDAAFASGKTTSLPSEAARATVLDFFATSCEPCKKTVPQLVGKATELRQDQVEVVLVGVLEESEGAEDAAAVLRSWGIARDFVVDRGGAIQQGLGIAALPATVVLDRRGVVRWIAPVGSPASDVAAAARRVAGDGP